MKKIKIPRTLENEKLTLRPVSSKYSKEVFKNFTDETTVLIIPSTPKSEDEAPS